jgi:hypothetical protein
MLPTHVLVQVFSGLAFYLNLSRSRMPHLANVTGTSIVSGEGEDGGLPSMHFNPKTVVRIFLYAKHPFLSCRCLLASPRCHKYLHGYVVAEATAEEHKRPPGSRLGPPDIAKQFFDPQNGGVSSLMLTSTHLNEGVSAAGGTLAQSP